MAGLIMITAGEGMRGIRTVSNRGPWLLYGATIIVLVVLASGALSGPSGVPARAGGRQPRGTKASRDEVRGSDFNGDGFADVAIGVPGEDIAEAGNAVGGAVSVLYGSAAGLSADGNQLWSQESPGIADSSEDLDEFGRYLAIGDFNGDGFGDLGIAAGREDLEGPPDIVDAGAVHVLYGSTAGLTSGSQ